MARVVRNGIPGLWDHDMTGGVSMSLMHKEPCSAAAVAHALQGCSRLCKGAELLQCTRSSARVQLAWHVASDKLMCNADTCSTPLQIQQLLEIEGEEERLEVCFEVFVRAHNMLRMRQRLKDLVEHRESDDAVHPHETGEVDHTEGDSGDDEEQGDDSKEK